MRRAVCPLHLSADFTDCFREIRTGRIVDLISFSFLSKPLRLCVLSEARVGEKFKIKENFRPRRTGEQEEYF